MNLRSQVLKGVVWTGVEKTFGQVVGFVQSVILARLLCPDDFGLTAMLGIFLLLGNALSDCGLGNALIAFGSRFKASGTLAGVERRAGAFTIGVGLVVYAVLACAAPGIASFYGRAELRDLVWVMGATVPLNAACVVWNARLNREMRFGLLSRVNMGVTLATSALGIWLAAQGFGVWSIAWMNVAWAASRIIAYAWAAGASGGGETSPLVGDFRLCLNYGWRLMVSELLGVLYGSSFHFVLGKMFGAASAGIFARGQRWAQLPGDVVNQSFGRVSLSAFARGEGGAWRYVALNVALVWPSLAALGAFAEPIVGGVLGPQWLPCVPYLRILLVGAAFAPFSTILVNALKAAGRSDLVLKGEAVKRPVAFVSMAVAAVVLASGGDMASRVATWDGVAVFCWVKAVNDAFEALVSVLLFRRLCADGGDVRGAGSPTAFFPWKVWREVRIAQSGFRFLSYREVGEGVRADAVFLWGSKEDGYRKWALEIAARDGSEIVYCEDGFVKSADTWTNRAAPLRYRRGCSVVFDRKGYYFDGTKPTDLETMLNDPDVNVSDDERAEARRLMKRLVDEKITKYNHQPLAAPAFGRAGRRKVLVVDQSAGDASIRLGLADETTFKAMLADAIRENPDADVLVKTHPDVLARAGGGGYYRDLVGREGLFKVTCAVNPYALLEGVDKVYVCSSQLGFEALIAGKEVHVYGMPFYAGWGATVDRLVNPRRTRKRGVEDLFAIFYLRYTKWVDPVAQRACTMDEALDRIVSLRREYRWTRHFNFVRGLALRFLPRRRT